MKVFIPMSDELLDGRAEMAGRLVPFNPEFLSGRFSIGEQARPQNWITESDYGSALARLASTKTQATESSQL
ncbi:MAG: hypothetical protein P8N51_06170 [Pseudomonadales bacterium]|jgi:hypothetical protein|nr:hypothetical protein [Pseudomonadales bacterium]MDG1441192.1 hypothetical protein [Pseudomonadales bacterium]